MAKTIIVTGGTRGIGGAISLLLKEEYNVIALYRSDICSAENFTLNSGNPSSLSIRQLDICNPEEVARFYNEIEKEGRELFALINNAGIIKDSLIHKMHYLSLIHI